MKWSAPGPCCTALPLGKGTLPFPWSILGGFSRNGGDGTDNVEKVIGLIGKKTILQAQHAF